MTSLLGISAFYHDRAAAILIDGKIIAAAQEERFTRKKHDSSYPYHAIEYVLKTAKLKLSEVNFVVFYEKPFLKFERLLETYVSFAPKGFKSFCMSMPIWLKDKLFQKKILFDNLKTHDDKFDNINKIYFSEHHFSHAASAFYPSPFSDASVLTLDGVGEWATTTVAEGKNNDLSILKEIHFPHSVGLLYSAFTYYTGFKVNSGEYKVMGLAPYGEDKFKNLILDEVIDLKDDGTFKLNMKYFDYAVNLKMTNENFSLLFGKPLRNPETEQLTQFHMDIAASIQAATEEIVLRLAKSISKESGSKNLCMAGGVALNCVANGKIVKEKIFDNVWVQPAAGDAGGALGAALGLWHKELNKERLLPFEDKMKGSYLGPEFSDSEIENVLKEIGANYNKFSEDEMLKITSEELSKEKTVGWFQGRMEFGPRALGGRSIIADPRSAKMQKNLNLKVKFRESFRPFAPSVLREEKKIEMTEIEKKLFGINKLNIKRSEIPAVTHVDYSARIQTVHRDTNSKYYKLIKSFQEITKCPVLVNTSFNVRGEPMVCSVEDAYRCFMGTDLDMLVCGNYILYKNKQNKKLLNNYKNKFKLD